MYLTLIWYKVNFKWEENLTMRRYDKSLKVKSSLILNFVLCKAHLRSRWNSVMSFFAVVILQGIYNQEDVLTGLGKSMSTSLFWIQELLLSLNFFKPEWKGKMIAIKTESEKM